MKFPLPSFASSRSRSLRAELSRDSRSKPSRPLIAGAAIVLLLVLVAILGPALAPHGPLERTLIAQIGGRTLGVPFPPFQSWEFPLGSDRFGRDLFSRLLWAVRPTLVLVTIVAAVRLALGLLIGAVAGWSRRLPGRALSLLTDAALAIPVLVVALAAITAVGIELGLPAFIFGMCLTGWGETAQTVRAQTQLLAERPFIQAARALGATGPQIMIRHIGRHLAPLLAMLFAFEISSALMLAAALGFLGYFIGGGVWVITDGNLIPVAERVAGLPELGQLVGTAEIRISSRPPWEMIFPGLTIVLAILGFALLGEGLRRPQAQERAPRRSRLGGLLGAAGARLEEAAVQRAGALDGAMAPRLSGALLIALLAGAGLLWWQGRGPGPSAAPAGVGASPLPAQAGWPAERGDPYGTLQATPPPAISAVSWEFSAPGGLEGGPAVAADGTIYVAGLGGALHAVAPDGQERWSAPLPHEPIGGPALAPDGTIYVADRQGGLNAFSPTGEPGWRFQSGYRSAGTSGPIVAPDGTIYYAVIDAVQAVTPDGQDRWLGRDPRLPYLEYLPPRLSPDGALVFLKDSAFSTADGSLVPLTIVPDQPRFADPTMVVGADGRTYYRSEHSLVPWRRVEAGVAVQPALGWSASNVLILPTDVGVTAGGTAWMLYTADFVDTRMVWIDGAGRQIGQAATPLRAGRAIAAAPDGTLQICGSARNRALHCAAFSPAAGEDPLWDVVIDDPGAVASGGAVAGDRIYIVTRAGSLYALE
jgi:peptide/nickel transport system permease protein